jgi:hypothetical protein
MFGSGVLEGRECDILNFYIWFNFLTRGREGRGEIIYFFALTL